MERELVGNELKSLKHGNTDKIDKFRPPKALHHSIRSNIDHNSIITLINKNGEKVKFGGYLV